MTSIPSRPQGCSSATRASCPSSGCALNGASPSRSRRRRPIPFSARVRAARPAARPVAPTRTSCSSAAATSAGACAKTSRSQNFGEEAAYCSLELALGADFADLFEVKEGRVREARASSRCRARATGAHVHLPARALPARDARRLHASRRASSGPHVTYEVIVPPRGAWSTCMQVTPVLDDAGDHAALPVRPAGRALDAGRAARGVDAPAARRQQRPRRVPACCSNGRPRTSPALRIFDPEYPDRAVVAAGAPWFMTLFGRDSLLTSWMTMLVDPDLALGHAADARPLPGRRRRPAHRGGAGSHPARDALRRDRVARARWRSRLLRHRRRDAAVRHARSASCRGGGTGATRSTRCCRRPTARSSGSIEYGDRTATATSSTSARTIAGLQNQGWKDSWDSMRFARRHARAARRSRCARCRATCTRRSSRARTARRRPATTTCAESLRARRARR